MSYQTDISVIWGKHSSIHEVLHALKMCNCVNEVLSGNTRDILSDLVATVDLDFEGDTSHRCAAVAYSAFNYGVICGIRKERRRVKRGCILQERG